MHRAMHRAMHCMEPSVTWRVTRRAARCWQAGAVCVLRSAAELVPETSRLGALWHGAAPPSQERREDILRAVNEVLLALLLQRHTACYIFPQPLYYLRQVLLALLTPDPSHARGLVHARVRRRLAASLRELCDPHLARTRLRL